MILCQWKPSNNEIVTVCREKEWADSDSRSRYISTHTKGYCEWWKGQKEAMPRRKRNWDDEGEKSNMNIWRGRMAAWWVLEMWALARLLAGLICFGCESLMIPSHRSVERFLTKCLPINLFQSLPSSYIKKSTLVVRWNITGAQRATVCMILLYLAIP